MTPEQCQESVIEQLQQLTDKKVLLVDEPSLTLHASLRLAGPSEAAHILRYRGNLKQHLPYLVASQCGLSNQGEKAYQLVYTQGENREFSTSICSGLQSNCS